VRDQQSIGLFTNAKSDAELMRGNPHCKSKKMLPLRLCVLCVTNGSLADI